MKLRRPVLSSVLPLALCLFLPVAACTQFPELDAKLDDTDTSAAFPKLWPLSDLETASQAVAITPATTQGIEGRISALQARANRLRNGALTRAERARLEAAIAR